MGNAGICSVCGGKGERIRPKDGVKVMCYACGGSGHATKAEDRWPNRR